MSVKLNRDFGVLKYNVSAEEGEVELKESFLDEHQVIQIDILMDWIADLNEFLEVIRGDQ
tara:strand:+ start:140 stop:319 length:180 start_codon:yes stop_codon:yes gene_type:complete